ncbi:hypothetical protein [Umezawaea sp. Da 62-37]|uniref:hypothetical protein n=1 Tax=Umezawaea sp. Da 62-37 TaxID=3075927 RepID=UPI0028F70800|nr:hypothetical protein [Umezawaea sp. Da 62-37]WNV87888.1 hypothetical protein RM788_06280 [Umezawaea sp. Da 62-37]
MTFTFGVYAGGLIGTDDGSPPERPEQTRAALDELHGDRPFLVRCYSHYSDVSPGLVQAPPSPEFHVTDRRLLDLVVCFREPGEDLTGWLEHLRGLLRRHGSRLAALQITEEPNHAGPGGDGEFPAVRRALVEGVVAAKREADALGLDVRIGCNSTAVFDPAQEFWTDLGRRGGPAFLDALDYVGLDFFPDVFHPVPEGGFAEIVLATLTAFREQSLKAAGVPASVPMRVTEHGWGTGPARSEARQAEVLETVVRTVVGAAGPLNITAYEHFALRDADSRHDQPLHRLGLLNDDYTPKVAFEIYRRLIAEFG